MRRHGRCDRKRSRSRCWRCRRLHRTSAIRCGTSSVTPRAIIDERWPQPDPQALSQSVVELIVQVNGKLRGRVRLPAGAERQLALDAALADPTVQRFVAGKTLRKAIHVPDKLVNLVV